MKTSKIAVNFFYALMVGIFTGGSVFAFKYISSYVIEFSNVCYVFVRSNIKFLPLFLIATALISYIAFCIVKWEAHSKGGGISTAILAIKGYASFHWLKNIFAVFFSANLSYFMGLPLGNEGPSVQIGTNIGKGVSNILRQNNQGHFMSLGATAGFSSATGAPISALFFAFEEIKYKLSLFNFFLVLISVSSSTAVNFLLSKIFKVSPYLFDFKITYSLSAKYIFIALIIGLVCGILSFAVTKLHLLVSDFVGIKLNRLNFKLKFLIAFILVFITGVFLPYVLGSGHSLIEFLLEKNLALYLLLLVLVLRIIFLLFLNSVGVTGGLFLPYLAIGALIGSVVSNILLYFGVVEQSTAPIIIIISITAFLASVLKIPLTAICFSLEALCGIHNLLFIIVAVLTSFFVVRILKLETFTEITVERNMTKNGLSK